MSKIILLSPKEKVINHKAMIHRCYDSYTFVRYFLGDNHEIDAEFFRLKKECGLVFFSLFIIDETKKIKYYFSSDEVWNNYYIKNNLINHDHLYRHALSICRNSKDVSTTLVHHNSCPILTPENKDVEFERKAVGKYSNGYGFVYKKGKYIEISGFGGAIDDKKFSAKLMPYRSSIQ
ncbi:hypothetical protein [Francisella sp. XLW-1]|uniref:hypothetical protein n=1 Tax=Francisella sp. XLW-1 TaxID=2610887 RepID=UPI00123D8886|nr:hypothetical protein [Francisella sp. XLW-1]